ncbi:MAG TPA: hypothetical protein VNT25_01290, partial [Allosphingosinicella sp.]|nr:hypothetical protein [Allosphingosinicella sp.]
MNSEGRIAPLLPALQARFGERVTASQAVRETHGRGEGVHEIELPDAVVFAHSTDEVAAVVG